MHTTLPLLPRLLLALPALACLSAPAAADIVLQRKPATATTAWSPRFLEGTPGPATSLSAGEEVVAVEIGSGNYIAQSFLGNDAYLRGVALYGAGLNPIPADYTITLLDYGPRPPVMTANDFNPREAPVVVVVGTFTLGSDPDAQIYLGFDGADSAFLRKNHSYAILVAATRDSRAHFYRCVTDTHYANGTGAIGPEQLSPDRFSQNGSRDFAFAIYTATFGR